MKYPKVTHLLTNFGNPAPNQLVIHTKEGTYFQSYNKTVAFISSLDSTIILDSTQWFRASRTTLKYRKKFLNLSTRELREKIESNQITFDNLN